MKNPVKFAENISMVKKYYRLAFVLSVLLASCAGLQGGAEKPEPPSEIMGKGRVSAEKLAVFLYQNNKDACMTFIVELATLYVDEV
jgi:hypothetical protein